MWKTKHWLLVYRDSVVEWVYDIQREYRLASIWAKHAISMMDSHTKLYFVPTNSIQCLACVCMYISSALWNVEVFTYEELLKLTDDAYTVNELAYQLRRYVEIYNRPKWNFDPDDILYCYRINEGNNTVWIAAYGLETKPFIVKIFEHDKKQLSIGFLRELRSVRKLRQHPHCTGFFGSWTDENCSYMMYPYYETTFAVYFRQANNLLETVRTALQQLLLITNFSHEKLIVHRDIKPVNIMFSPSGLHLCDWDSSTYGNVNSPCFTHPICTYPWRAPELWFSKLYNGNALDIWSIGCCFAEMVLGVPLFNMEYSTDETEVCRNIFQQLGTRVFYLPSGGYKNRKPWPEKLSSVLGTSGIDLLDRMLDLDPRKRISALGALHHNFFQ